MNIRNEGQDIFVDDIDALDEGKVVEEFVGVLGDLDARMRVLLDGCFGADTLGGGGGLGGGVAGRKAEVRCEVFVECDGFC